MKALKYITAAVTIAVLAACSDNGLDLGGFANDPDAVRINATVGDMLTRSNPIGAEKTDRESFNYGDRISIRTSNTSNQAPVVYTFINGVWTPDGGKYLKWISKTEYFEAYYPANGHYDGSDTFEVPTDQYTPDYLAEADYMRFCGEKVKEDGALNLTLTRETARIVISEFVWQPQFDRANCKIESVTISDGTTNVNAYIENDSKCYALLHPTDDIQTGNVFMVITVKDAVKNETTRLTISDIPAHKAGNSYSYKIILGKREATISGVTVEDWATGTIIDGEGFAEDQSGYKVTAINGVKTYIINNEYGFKTVNRIITSNTNELSSNIILAADITLTGENNYTPIGNEDNPYTGIFDGNSKTITGLHINNGSEFYQALIGNLDGGTVKDLTLAESKITGSNYVGGLVANARNSNILNATVKDCEITGTWCAGGAVGTIKENSTVSGITMMDSKIIGECLVGGIVGRTESATVTIKNCLVQSNTDKSVIITATDYIVGGIAASFLGDLAGCKVINKGSLRMKTPMNAGGIVGKLITGSIEACLVQEANVMASYKAGGIVGENTASISGSYAYGCTTGDTPAAFIGIANIVGENNGSITTCYYYNDFDELVRPVTDSSGQLSPGTPIDWDTAYENMNRSIAGYIWGGTYNAPTLTDR